jgi:hypothetical protein
MINLNDININEGIYTLLNRANLIQEEIDQKKLIDTNMSYTCNDYVQYFNSGYILLEIMGIVEKTSHNLICIEYTKQRIVNIKKMIKQIEGRKVNK